MNESDEKDGTDCSDAYETEESERKDVLIDAKRGCLIVLLLLIICYVNYY